jgi:transposase
MLSSLDAQIIGVHLSHTQDEIIHVLKIGRTRISRCIQDFRRSGLIPDALRIGRPSKRSSELTIFIESRTLEDPRLSAPELVREIESDFGVKVSRTTLTTIRKGLRFKDRPPRHNQLLTEAHLAGRVEFCRKMLEMPDSLAKIHFSDESRVVLGDDKQWIW